MHVFGDSLGLAIMTAICGSYPSQHAVPASYCMLVTSQQRPADLKGQGNKDATHSSCQRPSCRSLAPTSLRCHTLPHWWNWGQPEQRSQCGRWYPADSGKGQHSQCYLVAMYQLCHIACGRILHRRPVESAPPQSFCTTCGAKRLLAYGLLYNSPH